VILRAGYEPSESLVEELKSHVAHEMGPIAKPEKIQIVS
jgi:acetyl-CoA synthetase